MKFRIAAICLLFLFNISMAYDKTIVKVEPSIKRVEIGEIFVINITIKPASPIAGAQFSLYYDANILKFKNIKEGDLFKEYNTYFFEGDAKEGSIENVYGIITQQGGGSVSKEGTFATITFEAIGKGKSYINLKNVVVGNADGVAVPIEILNGSVYVGIEEENEPPSKPKIYGISQGYVNVTYDFYAVSYDKEGNKIRYGWDFNGDGVADKWTGYYDSNEKCKISYAWKEEGRYYIKVIAEDEKGKKSTWAEKEILIYKGENNTPPIVEILQPSNGSIVKGNLEINGKAWDVDGDEIIKVEIRIDEGEWHPANGTNEWKYSIDTKNLDNGLHRIYARAYDGKYGNISFIEIKVENMEEKKNGTWIIITIIAIIVVAIPLAFVIKKWRQQK